MEHVGMYYMVFMVLCNVYNIYIENKDICTTEANTKEMRE